MKKKILCALELFKSNVLHWAMMSLLFNLGHAEDSSWAASADLTLANKYIAHGMDIGDDKAQWQPSVSLKNKSLGLHVFYWSSLPFDRNTDANDEHDLAIRWAKVFGEGRRAVRWTALANYWLYPNLSISTDKNGKTIASQNLQGMKWSLGVALPDRIRFGKMKLTPSYDIYHWMPVKDQQFDSGTEHQFHMTMTSDSPFSSEQQLNWSVGVSYFSDGLFGRETGLAYNDVQLSTGIDLIYGFSLVPMLGYQWSHLDSYNTEDEVLANLTLSKTF